MAISHNEMKVLQLVYEDSRIRPADAAVMLGMTEEEVKAAIAKLEAEKVIVGYPALINWDKTPVEKVKAVIEVKVTPQRDMGFDAIAARIYRFDEVKEVYLMSGAYDLTVIISGRTLREVAQFVGERLAPIEGVTGTATHFILRKYKEKHLVFQPREPEEREFIFT